MRLSELWRTTTFRLTLLYGTLFSAGVVALLWMIYVQSAGYLTRRVDGILRTEADALIHSPRPGLRQRVIEDLTLNGNQTTVFGLFSARGERIAGNLRALPDTLPTNGQPIEVPPTPDFPQAARLMAHRLPTGETLVVGRDVSQLRELRAIITSALIWSGVSIILIGVACGIVLSIAPLQRLRRLQAVAHDIARGDLKQRMPTSQHGDELDMFADTVNYMVAEVERLMAEVKGVTAVIAHDLLNPLASATVQLRQLQHADQIPQEQVGRLAGRIEEVLERFRGILRIAELEVRQRRAGFGAVRLGEIVSAAADLYGPLAENAGARMVVIADPDTVVQADRKLLFEAVSNLVDNAIKFGGRGSTVQLRVGRDPAHPQLIVQDDGPGIPDSERGAVLQRFYRSERSRPVPGSGLGLSIVAAIVRLHDFQLALEDADPGVRAVIDCRTVATAEGASC